jgi:hypothetical protein
LIIEQGIANSQVEIKTVEEVEIEVEVLLIQDNKLKI